MTLSWYNLHCLDEQNTGALFIQPSYPVNNFMGRAPSMIRTFVLAVRLGNGGNRGGRFAMIGNKANKWKLAEARFRAEHNFTQDQMNGAGIYAIVNIQNGHVYIGQSVNLNKRKKDHFRSLSKNTHINSYLQNAYNCYGQASFRFIILESVDNQNELNNKEQYWIELTESVYNISRNVFETPSKFRQDKSNPPDGRYSKDGETFDRPAWHKWVYGGERKPNG